MRHRDRHLPKIAGRGASLGELTVVLFLMGVVLFLVAQLLVPSVMLFQVEAASADSQQAAWVLLHKLQEGILNSVAESVTVSADPPAVSFQPLRSEGSPFNPDSGAPVLDDRFVIFALDPARQVVWLRERRPSGIDFGDGSKPQQLSPGTLQVLAADSQPGDRLLCRNVTSLSFPAESEGMPVMPLQVTVTCAAPPAKPGKPPPEAWQVSTVLSCRTILW